MRQAVKGKLQVQLDCERNTAKVVWVWHPRACSLAFGFRVSSWCSLDCLSSGFD